MICVRISFADTVLHPCGYVDEQLEKACIPTYCERYNGIMKHWFDDEKDEFVYQWIPREEIYLSDSTDRSTNENAP